VFELIIYTSLASFMALIVAVSLSRINDMESDDDQAIPPVQNAPKQLPMLTSERIPEVLVRVEDVARAEGIICTAIAIFAVAAILLIWYLAESSTNIHKLRIAQLENFQECRPEHDGDVATMKLNNGTTECVIVGRNSVRNAGYIRSMM
jgi:hypothetical protein